MKVITTISASAVLLFAMQSANAKAPVTISDPSPAILSGYNSGSSHTFTYTITNNVPNRSFPITISGISSPVVRQTNLPNDCGNALPRGPSTCQLGFVIAPTSAQGGQAINQTLSINYQGRTPSVKNVAFTVSVPVLTAVGQDTTGTQPPLLAVSNDGSGNNWGVKTIAGSPLSGRLFSAGCFGNKPNAICIAAGDKNDDIDSSLLVASNDGGNIWAVKHLDGIIPEGTSFAATSCTGSSSTGVCTAVGTDFRELLPVLAVSTNGANTWTHIDIHLPPGIEQGLFLSTSCSGNNAATSVCAAGGLVFGEATLLAVSTNGGNTWENKTISNVPSAAFNEVSCTGNNSNIRCAAAGSDSHGSPLIALSMDNGNTWQKAITNFATNGELSAVSCIGSGTNASCVAGGQDSVSQKPLLAMSSAGGNNWSTKPISNFSGTGNVLSVSCTGTAGGRVCTAVGTRDTTTPLLIVSIDAGNTWNVKSFHNMPATGRFNATRCTGNGSTAICTAAGYDGNDPLDPNKKPLLVVSTDGGISWEIPTVTGIPALGSFYGTSATGGAGLRSLHHR